MTHGPLISVIVPTYNRSRYLVTAVEGVFAQTYESLEIIIVDDGSTDDTPQALKPYSGRVRCIYQENRGVSAARNRGILAAQGELLAFLDTDDVWLPQKIERQMACLERRPTAGLAHTDALYLHGDSDRTSKRPDIVHSCDGDCYANLFFGNRIVTSSVIVRRQCLEKVGGFDETIRYAEDYDLWIRLARHFEFAYCNEALVLYRLHPSNAIKDALALRRGDVYVLNKALKADPTLAERVGRRNVHHKLHELWSDIAYGCFILEDFAEARRSFCRAIRHCPTPRTFIYWISTLMPPYFIKLARLAKNRSIHTGSAVQKENQSLVRDEVDLAGQKDNAASLRSRYRAG
jgi:glycosyltransferase involved in cell wall biosynthesis